MFEPIFLVKTIFILFIFTIVITNGKKISPAVKHQVGALTLLFFLFVPFLNLQLFNLEVSQLPDFILDQVQSEDFSLNENHYSHITTEINSEVTNSLDVIENTPAKLDYNIIDIFWIAGIILLSLRLIVSLIMTYREFNNAIPIKSEFFNDILYKCEQIVRIKRKVKVCFSTNVNIPFTFGVFRPKIILPENYYEWSQEKMESVLVHELAHIKRFDFFWSLVGNLATILYWFNPLVWVLFKSNYIEREKSCDNIVIDSGINSTVYSQTLVEFARYSTTNKFVNLGIAISGKNFLEERIKSILTLTNSKNDSYIKKKIISIFVIAIIISVFSISPKIQAVIVKESQESEVSDSEYKNIEETLNSFYYAIQSGSSIQAIKYYSNTSSFGDELRMPLGITNTIDEGPMFYNRSLTPGHWENILIISEIKSITKENGLYKIKENFYLEAGHEDLKDDIQILKDGREIFMVLENGKYKFLNKKPVRSILFLPKNRSLKKVGISIAPDGLRCVHYIVKHGIDPYIKHFN